MRRTVSRLRFFRASLNNMKESALVYLEFNKWLSPEMMRMSCLMCLVDEDDFRINSRTVILVGSVFLLFLKRMPNLKCDSTRKNGRVFPYNHTIGQKVNQY